MSTKSTNIAAVHSFVLHCSAGSPVMEKTLLTSAKVLFSQVLGIVREELQQSHRDLVSVQRNDMRRGVAKPISCS